MEFNVFGTKEWRNTDGKLHRENGPAVVWSNGGTQWYINGQVHREDGPAVEFPSKCYKAWWLNGKYLTEEEHAFCVKHNISFNYYGEPEFPSDEIKTLYILKFQ